MEESEVKDRRLTHRVHTRISKKKYDELALLLAKSKGIKSLSALLRHILEGDKILVTNDDASNNKILIELGAVRRELHAIGVNINQVAKRFHQEKLPESRLAEVLNLAGFYQQADQKISEVILIISKISSPWLPE